MPRADWGIAQPVLSPGPELSVSGVVDRDQGFPVSVADRRGCEFGCRSRYSRGGGQGRRRRGGSVCGRRSGRWVGSVCVAVGVAVGSGVFVGAGVSVGFGVGVGVRMLVETSWGTGVGAGSPPKMPQARNTGRTSAPAASLHRAPHARRPVFLSPMSQALQVGSSPRPHYRMSNSCKAGPRRGGTMHFPSMEFVRRV